MSKPRKKKAYNKQKGVDATLAQLLKDFVIMHSMGSEGCDPLTRDGKVIPSMRGNLLDALDMRRFNWNVTLAVCCRAWDYKRYLPTAIIRSTEPRTRLELSDALKEQLDILLTECNQKDICDIIWVGSPTGVELSTEELHNLIRVSGCYDKLTPWQKERLECIK